MRAPRHGVVTYGAAGAPTVGHEARTRDEIARRLAAILGCDYLGEHDPRARYAGPLYFVPRDTLTSDGAARVGIRGEHDLFGGVVPRPFMATKTITHPLLDVRSHAPQGWSAEFPHRVAEVVLDGYSAFSTEDALEAGRRLLKNGAVRVKLGSGIAGRGQFAVGNAEELAQALAAVDPEELARAGAAVEKNLEDVTTLSVGRIRVSDFVCTYCGTQHMTANHLGHEVYGGSQITVVPGDFDALLALRLPDAIRLAIAQACTYDAAANHCFAGFYASRRNYDVAQGQDAAGRRCSGVLEQSWRLGGASGAEIGALEAFRADPSLRAIRAMTREVYGEAPALPAEATVYFSGVDPRAGPLTKYAWTEPYADP